MSKDDVGMMVSLFVFALALIFCAGMLISWFYPERTIDDAINDYNTCVERNVPPEHCAFLLQGWDSE